MTGRVPMFVVRSRVIKLKAANIAPSLGRAAALLLLLLLRRRRRLGIRAAGQYIGSALGGGISWKHA